MNFELLPNETLLDLFDYFNSTELFCIFYGLNSRFNLLIYHPSRSYNFNFQSVSKRSFDIICQQHLPVTADRVIVLRLFDYNDTPNQINFFFSYTLSLKQFTHLQLLSVSNIDSYQTLTKIINECYDLCNLTHFKLYSNSLQDDRAHFQLIVDQIWSLPKLIHCDFYIKMSGEQLFCVPTKISLFLECVLINGSQLKWNQINQLFQYTSRLKRLWVQIFYDDHDDYHSYLLSTLNDLKISCFYENKISKLFVFLKNTPNLYYLDIDVNVLIDGHRWEQFIGSYLSKLKIFQLEMHGLVSNAQNIQEQVDRLVDSFRSPFWIDEHRWFIQCYADGKMIHLSTLSKTVCYLSDATFDPVKSTCPYDFSEQQFYKTQTCIMTETFFDQLTLSNVQMHNITYLTIKLPISNLFWYTVPSLNQLRYLVVSSYVDIYQSQLQALFDQTSLLEMLILHQDESLPLQRSLFKYTNVSVRHLHLQNSYPDFSKEDCMALARSPLGTRCEVLSIRVNNRENIIYLVNNMINLRSLDVELDNDVYGQHLLQNINNNGTTSSKDELVPWLKDH